MLLEDLVKDFPDNPNYYFSLFDIYMDENELDKALKEYDNRNRTFGKVK